MRKISLIVVGLALLAGGVLGAVSTNKVPAKVSAKGQALLISTNAISTNVVAVTTNTVKATKSVKK